MKNNQNLFIYFAYLLVFIYLILKCDFNSIYTFEYIILLLSFLVVGGLLCLAIYKQKANIFEPIVLILALLIVIFSIAPILLTASGKVILYNVNFMNGCIKSTLIYILGSFSFYIGYYTKIKTYKKKAICDNAKVKHNKFAIMIIIWLVCFILGLFYQIHSGKSLLYIFSIGGMGEISNEVMKETSLGFLVNFTYCLIVPWLYIIFKSKNKILKIVLTILMIILCVIYGFRFIFVIMFLSYFTIRCVSKNKIPKFKNVIIIGVVALIVFTLVGNARDSIRHGHKFEWTFNNNTMLYTLESNFNIYQPFYAIVTNYPSKYKYTLGEGVFYDTIMIFFPRALWKEKPIPRDYAINKAIRYSIADDAIDIAGIAVPNIAEYYVDFGILGVSILMYFFGKLTKLLYIKYFNTNFKSIVIYSVIYSSLFQVVIRGFTASNFYLILFLILPTYFIDYNEKKGLCNNEAEN